MPSSQQDFVEKIKQLQARVGLEFTEKQLLQLAAQLNGVDQDNLLTLEQQVSYISNEMLKQEQEQAQNIIAANRQLLAWAAKQASGLTLTDMSQMQLFCAYLSDQEAQLKQLIQEEVLDTMLWVQQQFRAENLSVEELKNLPVIQWVVTIGNKQALDGLLSNDLVARLIQELKAIQDGRKTSLKLADIVTKTQPLVNTGAVVVKPENRPLSINYANTIKAINTIITERSKPSKQEIRTDTPVYSSKTTEPRSSLKWWQKGLLIAGAVVAVGLIALGSVMLAGIPVVVLAGVSAVAVGVGAVSLGAAAGIGATLLGWLGIRKATKTPDERKALVRTDNKYQDSKRAILDRQPETQPELKPVTEEVPESSLQHNSNHTNKQFSSINRK